MKVVRAERRLRRHYYGIFYHGVASTHIDALCHTWDDERCGTRAIPRRRFTLDGATSGHRALERGIITRAVMLDVPRHRGVPCVTEDSPVHGWELDDILAKRNLTLAGRSDVWGFGAISGPPSKTASGFAGEPVPPITFKGDDQHELVAPFLHARLGQRLQQRVVEQGAAVGNRQACTAHGLS